MSILLVTFVCNCHLLFSGLIIVQMLIAPSRKITLKIYYCDDLYSISGTGNFP